jgi:hypothetical protein
MLGGRTNTGVLQLGLPRGLDSGAATHLFLHSHGGREQDIARVAQRRNLAKVADSSARVVIDPLADDQELSWKET